MNFPTVLVRAKAHRYLFLIFTLLAMIPAGMLILAGGEPEVGGIAARLARGGPSFLVTAGALGMLYLMILLTNYLVLEAEGDILIFRGAFGRTKSFRIDQLERVTAGRALYSFQFRTPKERSVSLMTYMGTSRFMDILSAIAERRAVGSSAFRFEYGGKTREF